MSMPTGRPAVPPPPRDATAPPITAGPPERDRRVPTRVWVVLVVVVACGLALTTVVLAVRDTIPDGARPAPARTLSGALNGRQEAQFEVASGAESVTVRSAELGDQIFRVSTPEGGNLVPEIRDEGGRIRLSLVHSGAPGQGTVEVLLSTAVRWQLRLAGGGTEEVVDFRTGRLSGVELVAGAARIDVSLPRPEGTLVVRLVGGAGQLTVRAPAGPPAQVRVGVGVGAGEVTVDGRSHGALSAGSVLAPDGWDQAIDRYDIEAVGGVSKLTVERT